MRDEDQRERRGTDISSGLTRRPQQRLVAAIDAELAKA
jgi:hypothetical protein